MSKFANLLEAYVDIIICKSKYRKIEGIIKRKRKF